MTEPSAADQVEDAKFTDTTTDRSFTTDFSAKTDFFDESSPSGASQLDTFESVVDEPKTNRIIPTEMFRTELETNELEFAKQSYTGSRHKPSGVAAPLIVATRDSTESGFSPWAFAPLLLLPLGWLVWNWSQRRSVQGGQEVVDEAFPTTATDFIATNSSQASTDCNLEDPAESLTGAKVGFTTTDPKLAPEGSRFVKGQKNAETLATSEPVSKTAERIVASQSINLSADGVQTTGTKKGDFVAERSEDSDNSKASVSGRVESDALETQDYDDLTRLQGISPTIAKWFYSRGVTRYDHLSDMKDSTFRDLLAGAPSKDVDWVDWVDWRDQASFAQEGNWQGLSDWKSHSHSGFETGHRKEAHSRSEVGAGSEVGAEIDDLTQIDGIGPATQRFLKEAGIVSYSDLIAAGPEKIRTILGSDSGNRFNRAQPDRWCDEAKSYLAGCS